MLNDGALNRDPGADYYTYAAHHPAGKQGTYHQLETLGYRLIFEPLAETA